jgi:anti-anti-sigma factor
MPWRSGTRIVASRVPASRPSDVVSVAATPGSAYAATVRLHGEHDMATAAGVAAALASVGEGDVLIDLARCEFLDSSIVRTILDEARARGAAGSRLDIYAPYENREVARVLQVTSLGDVLWVRRTRPA